MNSLPIVGFNKTSKQQIARQIQLFKGTQRQPSRTLTVRYSNSTTT